MPIVSSQRENLALRLRQNWLARENSAPTNGVEQLDDSLTSLTWLQNLNIMSITSPSSAVNPQKVQSAPSSPVGPLDPHTQNVDPNSVLPMNSSLYNPHHVGLLRQTSAPNSLENIDYKTNPYVKPPYSYATLICMAMKASKKNKITLSGIYSWITENYMYYRVADPSWQNSIRHNLSLNKCFQKVARRKDEPGKGGFWKLNPEYSDMFVNGVFKKRRHAGNFVAPTTPTPKRIKKEVSETERAVAALEAATSNEPKVVVVKQEPELRPDAIIDPSSDSTLAAEDISWNALLEQDIDVGGMKMKTEQIIDGTEGNNQDTPDELEELLRDADLCTDDQDSPLDLCSGGALDLTVSGIGIKPPEWWEKCTMEESQNETTGKSGLSTPIAPSPISEAGHPWEESNKDELDRALDNLNVGNLLDFNSLHSPSAI